MPPIRSPTRKPCPFCLQLTLVTTEKDLARLRGTDGVPDGIVPFAVQLEFDDPAKLKQLISDHLYKARERLFSRR